MKYRNFHRQSGLTLIELMVSVTIGLLILLGLTTIFANNSRARTEIERNGRQLENGRYAMQLLTADLQLAGFYNGYYPSAAPAVGSAPPAASDICAFDTATITNGMPFHVQGFNDSSGSLTCISDVKSGTDVIVVRHAASCSSANPADVNCDSISSAGTFIQVNGCANDPSIFKIDTNTSNLTLQKIDCATTASIRKYRTNIYFIANNNATGDGIPTLKRAELGSGAFAVVPLVEGIENLQIEYGIAANNSSTTPVQYVTGDTITTGLGWWNVMAVKISLLSRNEAPSAGYIDSKTYVLGSKTINATNDGYRRHVYTGLISMINPAGRR